LATTHGGIITQNEENQQGVFQAVMKSRKLCPKITKKGLMASKNAKSS
jgi:hypothetical protein